MFSFLLFLAIGEFEVFDENIEDSKDMLELLKASVTFSGISPAVRLGDQLYMTGKAIYENDVLSVINHCESLGYKDEEIVIDTIISGLKEPGLYNHEGVNAFSVLKRSSEVFKYYQHMHGIMRAKDGHRDVNFRYVVAPSFDMPTKIMPLKYTPEESKSLLNSGKRDSERSIYELLHKTDQEIIKRINSPVELRFHNKERQARHE